MRNVSRVSRLGSLVLVVTLAACSQLTGSDNGTTFRRLDTPNFVFLYTNSDVATIDTFVADMEAKLVRLRGVYRVDSMAVLTVVLYPDRRSFQNANNSSSWVTGVTRGTTRMEIVSPFGPNQVFDLWPDTRAEHMLAHLVQLAVNPEVANNPRWLWESLALYESGQKTPANIVEFFAPDAEPALSQLNGGFGTPIIDVGFYLGEFLNVTFGPEVVIALIEAEGNLETIGLTGEQFIAQFVAFVRARYGLPS